MILTTHALTGAVIGKNIRSPWLVILVSLIVHFIMDSFRHGEYFDSRKAKVKDTAWKIILDLSVGGLMIFGYIILTHPQIHLLKNILIGAFFSMFPDLLTVLYWKYEWKFLHAIRKFHELSHRYGRYPKFAPERQWNFRNSINDILISTVAALLLYF